MPSPARILASSALSSALTFALALAVSLAAPACGKDKSKDRGAAEARGARLGASVEKAKRPLVVFVDDTHVAAQVEVGSEPRPLTELVPGLPPIESWLALEVIEVSGKVHTTMAPAKNQPGKVPAIAAGPAGLELGFRAPADVGPLAAPVRSIVRVTIKAAGDNGQIAKQAAVAADHGGGDSGGNREHADEARPAVSADLKIEITGAAGDSVFTGDEFDALPVIKAPAGDTETPGWNLLDVLRAAGIKKPQIVHLTDGEGATLQLEAADFDPARSVLYLKLNRSGVLRFRAFHRAGDAWEVGGELRGITKIHVVK